jgi:hypothetical protein
MWRDPQCARSSRCAGKVASRPGEAWAAAGLPQVDQAGIRQPLHLEQIRQSVQITQQNAVRGLPEGQQAGDLGFANPTIRLT